jgi:hypothetical protein
MIVNKVPILLITFNRVETTKKVLESIRSYKPSSIYLSSDGPRNDSELKIVEEVRELLDNSIDWNCKIYKKYNSKNLGCKHSVSQAINWVFEHEQKAIIIEDDCVASPDFYIYCEKLLDKYKNSSNVFHIDGSSFLDYKKLETDHDYYFSRYALIWGWATWKRAWKLYDINMTSFEKNSKSNFLDGIFKTPNEKKYWYKKLEDAKNIDTWDYQWFYTIWKNRGYTIQPTINLIKNIGFDELATHTKSSNHTLNSMVASKKDFNKIRHPKTIEINPNYDIQTSYRRFNISKSYYKRIIEKLLGIIYTKYLI